MDFFSVDIEKAKSFLEEALDIKFEVHDSDYQGGEYFSSGKTSDEHFILERNVDPYDDEPAELSFPKHPVLFYINDASRSQDLQGRMVQKTDDFVLLRHENLR